MRRPSLTKVPNDSSMGISCPSAWRPEVTAVSPPAEEEASSPSKRGKGGPWGSSRVTGSPIKAESGCPNTSWTAWFAKRILPSPSIVRIASEALSASARNRASLSRRAFWLSRRSRRIWTSRSSRSTVRASRPRESFGMQLLAPAFIALLQDGERGKRPKALELVVRQHDIPRSSVEGQSEALGVEDPLERGQVAPLLESFHQGARVRRRVADDQNPDIRHIEREQSV